MDNNKRNYKRGVGFMRLSLFAFGGLGLEVLLLLVMEPLIYGKALNEFSTVEHLLHWTMTCIVWGIVSFVLIRLANNKYNFDMFSYKEPLELIDWVLCILLLSISMVISYIDWNGFKIMKEFLYNGWLKFIFQYIYYLFETVLILLIIVFAQRAGELWLKKSKIPWGGIFVGLTWGLTHALTKGQLYVGVLSAIGGLMYGIAYLLCKKNLYITYPLVFLMFVL